MEGYEVLEKLGSGSFGTIRRIVRKSDKKVLQPFRIPAPRLFDLSPLLHMAEEKTGRS